MKKIIALLYPIAGILILSCEPTIKLARTYHTDYKSEDFERDDISAYGIAVMPIAVDPGLENQAEILEKEISNHLDMNFGEENVVTPDEVAIQLNTASLTHEFDSALNFYRSDGTIPKDILLRVGTAMAVDYLLLLHLTSDFEGITPKSIEEVHVNSCVWSTQQGRVVWGGSGGYSAYKGDPSELLARTSEEIASRLGTAEHEGSGESRSDLIHSVKNAHGKTVLCIVSSTVLAGVVITILIFASNFSVPLPSFGG